MVTRPVWSKNVNGSGNTLQRVSIKPAAAVPTLFFYVNGSGNTLFFEKTSNTTLEPNLNCSMKSNIGLARSLDVHRVNPGASSRDDDAPKRRSEEDPSLCLVFLDEFPKK